MRQTLCTLSLLLPSLAATAQDSDVAVSADTLALNTAVVTGIRLPATTAQSPLPTRLISASDIRKSDATNIQDLLQHELPGFEFTQTLSGQTYMSMAGFGGQNVIFLINGERLAGETMDNIDYARINMSDVERIEVVKGAASALYSSSATGGVINIITRQHLQRPWLLHLDARVADHHSRRLNLTQGWQRGRLTQLFDLQHTHINTYKLENPTDVTLYTKYSLSRALGGYTWQAKEQLAYQFSDAFRLSGRASYFFRERDYDEGESNRYRDFAGGMKAQWSPSRFTALEVNYTFDQYDKSDLYHATKLDIRDYSNVQHSLRALYTQRLDTEQDHRFALGADYLRDYLLSYQFAGEHHVQHSFDAFAQYEWQPSSRWHWMGAVRFDHFDQASQQSLTTKLSGRYRQGALSLRASYGSGFRAPSLKERYMQYHINDVFLIRGNANLKPERSHSFHFSAEYIRPHYQLSAHLSYALLDNRIASSTPSAVRDANTGLPIIDYINVSNYRVLGVELGAQTRHAWMDGYFTTRWNYAYTLERAQRSQLLTSYVPARPHSATFRLDYEHRPKSRYGYELVLSGRFLSGFSDREVNHLTAATYQVHYPAYCLLRLALNQQLGHAWTLSLAADNLLNYRPHVYYANSPLTTGINISLGVRLALERL